jgi:hypothetical protein
MRRSWTHHALVGPHVVEHDEDREEKIDCRREARNGREAGGELEDALSAFDDVTSGLGIRHVEGEGGEDEAWQEKTGQRELCSPYKGWALYCEVLHSSDRRGTSIASKQGGLYIVPKRKG